MPRRPITAFFPFRYLKPGERFRFHYYPTDRVSDEVFTARSRGWYQDKDGKVWRTSATTAVKPEAQ